MHMSTLQNLFYWAMKRNELNILYYFQFTSQSNSFDFVHVLIYFLCGELQQIIIKSIFPIISL